MVQLITALLVFSHFNPALPKLKDIQTKPKPALVRMYSEACLDFFKRPDFQGYNMPKLVQMLLDSAKSSRWLDSNSRMQDLVAFYNKICKSDPDLTALDGMDSALQNGAAEYRALIEGLPETGDLKKISLQQSTDILSGDKKIISDLSIREARRKSIKIDQLPAYIPKTFVAVEDNRFFEHKGVDEISILRALLKDATSSGSRQGASTISQQVARNLYLSPVPTLQRKFQEILLADRLEKQLSKKEILELYINLIYFGRNSWGIEKAALSYFGKEAKFLTPLETAFIVGIIHGPNLYKNRPLRIARRTQFVLDKMRENGILQANAKISVKDLKILSDVDPYNIGYMRDFVIEQTRKINPSWIGGGAQIQTSIDSKMQALANAALQDGLIYYEKRIAQRDWEGPLDNISDEITKNTERIEEAKELHRIEVEKNKESLFSSLVAKPKTDSSEIEQPWLEKPWVAPLSNSGARFTPPVANWRLAVSLGDSKIGFLDGTNGTLVPLSLNWAYADDGDVFFVRPQGKGWEIVQAPAVNGAVVVMSPSGRVLALVGGFSYAASSWNRATQALRQPGSLMKPFTYLAALQKGIQPNTLLSDAPIYFPPTSRGGRPWTPINFGKESGGPRPMRWALENSRNVMTAHLMSRIGLDPIRDLTEQMGLYENASHEYPFILGSQENTLINMVKAYGEIANGGNLLKARVIDSATDFEGKTTVINNISMGKIPGLDEISLFQIRYLMQGVIERGTAARLSKWAPYLAGKTGTSNESKDVWFVGYTPNIIIGVYVGYDNPETMGGDTTGGSVALPIFERIFTESFKIYYPPEVFPPPPKGVVMLPTHRITGQIVSAVTGNDIVMEAYREGANTKDEK